MIHKKLFITILLCILLKATFSQTAATSDKTVLPGAYRIDVYLHYLEGKRVGVFANQTSMVGQTHLVDTLRKRGVNIVKIFAPEHGFRGVLGAGEELNNDVDKQTGIPIVSLYGKKKIPDAEDLKDVD